VPSDRDVLTHIPTFVTAVTALIRREASQRSCIHPGPHFFSSPLLLLLLEASAAPCPMASMLLCQFLSGKLSSWQCLCRMLGSLRKQRNTVTESDFGACARTKSRKPEPSLSVFTRLSLRIRISVPLQTTRGCSIHCWLNSRTRIVRILREGFSARHSRNKRSGYRRHYDISCELQ
jgi:hypothetical protein